MESTESIRFDEYMECGIPASLLKGLGYTEERPDQGECSSNEIEGSCDEADDENEQGGTQHITNSSVRVHTAKLESSAVVPSSKPQMRKHRSGRIAQQTIIKGNIIYERTESGGVVASLIKTENSYAIGTPSANQNTPKQHSRKIVSSNPFEIELPHNCPINEDSVGNILDESIFVTEDVRRKLITLKDNLRRQGGGVYVTPQLKPVHMRKRDEIAKQLTILYIDYQEAIDKICNVVGALSEVQCSSASPLSPKPSVVNKRSKNYRSTHSSKLKRHRPAVKGREKVVCEQRPVGVSDDLWMSCEPGSDDELHLKFGLEQKQKKLGASLKFRSH